MNVSIMPTVANRNTLAVRIAPNFRSVRGQAAIYWIRYCEGLQFIPRPPCPLLTVLCDECEPNGTLHVETIDEALTFIQTHHTEVHHATRPD